MKKLMLLLLAAAVILTAFTGCGTGDVTVEEKPRTLRICVDYGDTYSLMWGNVNECLEIIMDYTEMYVKEAGLIDEIEWEAVPMNKTDRDIVMTRIKTELMSGKGPDVFICTNPDPGDSFEAMFPFPVKAMRDGRFLPLDDYIKNAQFADWENFCKPVMEAGKNGDGQQVIIPITFDYLMGHFRYDESINYPAETTWDDVVNSNDPVLLAPAEYVYEYDLNFFNNWFPSIFGEYVDYENEALLLTEEEITKRVYQAKDLFYNSPAGQAPTNYTYLATPFSYSVNSQNSTQGVKQSYMHGISYREDISLVPLYNVNGGATAEIKSFCAVNSQTENPDAAFCAIDFLLSNRNMRKSSLYIPWLKHMLIDTTYVCSEMTSQQGPELERVLGQISEVRYWTPLDFVLAEMLDNCRNEMWNEENTKKEISKAFAEMKMILAES